MFGSENYMSPFSVVSNDFWYKCQQNKFKYLISRALLSKHYIIWASKFLLSNTLLCRLSGLAQWLTSFFILPVFTTLYRYCSRERVWMQEILSIFFTCLTDLSLLCSSRQGSILSHINSSADIVWQIYYFLCECRLRKNTMKFSYTKDIVPYVE